MVVFGRPKGHRGSYKQWKEDGIAPQAVFEILPPEIRDDEMAWKFQFYDSRGVQEYDVYAPQTGAHEGWRRKGGRLREIADMNGHVSPLLGIRFRTRRKPRRSEDLRPRRR